MAASLEVCHLGSRPVNSFGRSFVLKVNNFPATVKNKQVSVVVKAVE